MSEWSMETGDYDRDKREVEIDGLIYRMPDHLAGMTHMLEKIRKEIRGVRMQLDTLNTTLLEANDE